MSSRAGRPAPVLVSAVVVGALFALCAWRAATQSVSHDEALTWLMYLREPLATMFNFWQANNHVLHTLLAWLSVHAFGHSELALRLPALLGALLCLLALRRLALRACGEGWLHLLALLLLAGNPLVLDFLVAARGYGLALGTLLWAAVVLAAQLEAAAEGRTPRVAGWVGASLLLGACVAANLAFAPAVAGLALAALLAGGRSGKALLALALPGLLLAAGLVTHPMRGTDRSAFITGVDSLAATVDSLVRPTLAHPSAAWRPDPQGPLVELVLLPAGEVVAALLVLLLLVRAADWARGRGPRDEAERLLRLVGGGLLLALLLVVGLNAVGGLLYPADRTALYLLPMGGLSALLLARRGLRGRWRPVATATLGLMALVAGWQLLELQVSGFADWTLDTGTRRFFERIEAREAGARRAEPVQVRVAHRFLAPALQFYQSTRGQGWMAPVPAEWRRDEATVDYLLLPAALGAGPAHWETLDVVAEVRLLAPKRRG